MISSCVVTRSVTPVRVLMTANQSAFYTVESVRTGPESSPLVRSGPRFITYPTLKPHLIPSRIYVAKSLSGWSAKPASHCGKWSSKGELMSSISEGCLDFILGSAICRRSLI